MAYGDNFGLITIDWAGPDPRIWLQIRDEDGDVFLAQHSTSARSAGDRRGGEMRLRSSAVTDPDGHVLVFGQCR